MGFLSHISIKVHKGSRYSRVRPLIPQATIERVDFGSHMPTLAKVVTTLAEGHLRATGVIISELRASASHQTGRVSGRYSNGHVHDQDLRIE